MNLWARALVGVLLGSSVTLVVHPIAREYLIGAIHLSSPKRVRELANTRPSALPLPTSTVSAAIWLQIASEKALAHQPLSKAELKTLTGLANEGSKIDRPNAFWLQMAAVFESYSNHKQRAMEDWVRASHCSNWNDFQTQRLLRARSQLASEIGSNQAWTYGYVYFERSEAPALAIEKYAQQILVTSKVEDLSGLQLRYATICNGSLLRDGARSIRVGYRGAGIVELATYPPGLSSSVRGYRRIWIAQTSMTAKLRQNNFTEEARKADQIFRQNEGWLALVERQSPEENLRFLSLEAIALSALPGAFVIGSFLGLVLFGTTKLMRPSATSRFNYRTVVPIGVATAAGIFFLTGSLLASIAVGTCLAFLCFSPKAIRKSLESSMGIIFSTAIFCVWVLFSAALCGYIISSSTAGASLLPLLGPTGEYLADSKIFLAISFTMIAFLFLIAPSWALAKKLPTPLAFQKAIMILAILLLAGDLILGASSALVAVYGNRVLGQELQNIVENEPIYYLLK